MHRLLTGLVAVLALTGCAGAVSAPEPSAAPQLTSSAVPEDGRSLRDLGFVNGPDGFSVPRDAAITDQIDSSNNITVVMTSPDGLTVAAYYRRVLPELGFRITADERNSLLFEGGGYDGAFTVSSGFSAVTLRTDR